MLFFVLLVTLVIFVTAFIAFLVSLRRMNSETFNKLCTSKVIRIAKRRGLLLIPEAHLSNFERETLPVNHVLFGEKYIYLISDFLLKGFVSGEEKDNSWIYFNNITKKTHYLDNLNAISDKNIRDFSGILQISPELIVSICVVPNECDFKIKGDKSDKKNIVHYSSLRRMVRRLENKKIDALDKQQIIDQFNLIKAKNDERNK